MVAVLFNRKREAAFSVQLYIEPRQGVPAFLASGGTLYVATLSAAKIWWPKGVVPSAPLRHFLTASEGIE